MYGMKDLVEILDLISNSEADSLSKARPLKILHYLQVIHNYTLLMSSTHDHEDHVRYWLTEVKGRGLPIYEMSLLPQVDQNKKVIDVIALLNY